MKEYILYFQCSIPAGTAGYSMNYTPRRANKEPPGLRIAGHIAARFQMIRFALRHSQSTLLPPRVKPRE